MTRKRMYNAIKKQLEDYQMDCDEQCMQTVDVAVDEALEYVLSFALEMSAELTAAGLYSHAMVAGVVINKIKILRGELEG